MKTEELASIATTLIADIEQAMRAEVRDEAENDSDREPEARDYVYASGYEPCTRAMALAMMGKRAPFSDDAIVRMQMGKERERAARIRMEKAEQFSELKFELVSGQKRIALTGADDKKIISGRCEGEFELRRDGKTLLVPWEMKDWYPPTVDRINTFSDLLHVSKWTRKAAYQFAAYLWGADREVGLFILNRKGMPKFLWTTYEECLPLADEFLGRAEDARAHVREDTVPEYTTDLDLCKQCEFANRECFPPVINVAAEIELDEEAVENVERWLEVAAVVTEGKKLWEWIKKRYKGRERTFVGRAVVTGKRDRDKPTTVLGDVPPDVTREVDVLEGKINDLLEPFRQQEMAPGSWRTKVKRIEGTTDDEEVSTDGP